MRPRSIRVALVCVLSLCACAKDGADQMNADNGPADPDQPLAGVGGDGDGDRFLEEPELPESTTFLSPTAHLTRASIALRGLRPTREELEAVREDPTWLPAIVDYYLDTEELGAVLRELHEEVLLTGVDPVIYPAGFPAMGALEGRGLHELNTSIVEAPVRLIEHVVMSDRPYTEIVTADYAFADEVVATVWGLPYDENGEAWQETSFPDSRPVAGILSDSFLFTRHSTTFSNKGRGRANAISRALLCYDFLSGDLPVDSTIDLADPEAVANAVVNNEACASCHRTLDPLAAYFSPYYPIYVPSDLEAYPFSAYEPAFRSLFRVTDPSYFGGDGGELRELGQSIADDPRFGLCTAQRFYAFLAQVELDQVPLELATALESVLVESDMSAKALLKTIVLSDAFRIAGSTDAEDAESTVGLLRMRPSAIAASVERLTGYRWRTQLPIDIAQAGQVGEVDLMLDAFFGFEVLAGGIDGRSVTRPSHTTSATVSLVIENLAARAAEHVVRSDFAEPDPKRRRLLRAIDASETSDQAIRAQLAELQLELFGQTLATDHPHVLEARNLFMAALATSNAERAWTLTLYALLQDPRFVHY